jgi:clathrin heavy chain
MLQGWLEARNTEGNQTPALHNALAMIYITINKDPQSYLINNQFYDSKVVGKFAEDRNPDLAYIAYKRAWGSCDYELVDVTNKNYLYRLQARYLVERQSEDLWAHVLREDNPHRKQVIEQIVQIALPEAKNPDEVSATVKAFMDADMPSELIELLERIVLHNSDFSNNRNLQNLLLLTAIKADKTRVMDYINRLDNYDGKELAKIALQDEYQLYDEALAIFKKTEDHVSAVEVLLEHIKNLDQAAEFAEKINNPEVWSKLGNALLNEDRVREAIDSFVKAKDSNLYPKVISCAQRHECFDDLITYLLMAKESHKDSLIDGEIIFSYAKINKLIELEEFIAGSNQADIERCGDRCYDEQNFEAAKILYSNKGNNARLASCYVHLKEYQNALDAARKSDAPKVWKEVNFACVRAKEFRMASIAGLQIIIHPDHLDDLINHYEKYGYYSELVQLIENGLGMERAHMGMFTELGVLYAKYQPDRLMDHARTYYNKINIPKLLRACERY